MTPTETVRRKGRTEERESLTVSSGYGSVREDTQSIGMGPVVFDVEFAKAHGWDISLIRRTWEIVHAVVLGASTQVAIREGRTATCPNCEQFTYPDKPCHLCEADRIEAERRIYRGG